VVEDQALLSEVIAEGLAPDFEVVCAATVADGVEGGGGARPLHLQTVKPGRSKAGS
jgi:hypothetical protein